MAEKKDKQNNGSVNSSAGQSSDINEQIDLGLSKLLDSLSSQDDKSEEPSEQRTEGQITGPALSAEDSDIDGLGLVEPSLEINELKVSLVSESVPPILLVPQFLDKLAKSDEYSKVDLVILHDLSVSLVEKLFAKDELSLALSVLEQIKPDIKANADLKNKTLALVDNYLDQSKDESREVTFENFDPALQSKKLALLDLQRELSVNKTPENKTFEGQNLDFSASLNKAPNASYNSAKTDSSGYRNIVLFLLLAAAIYFFFWISKNFINLSAFFPQDDYQIADNNIELAKNSEQLFEPVLERQEISNLSALMYDVDKAPSPTVPVAVATLAPVSKAVIDTSGPVEPERIKQILDGINNSVYERPVEPRIPERPMPRTDRFPRQDDRPLDRDDRPGRWDTGQRYEVMINTSVMDAPSFNAREVEELYVGDRVRVESRLGRWLKIKSRDGKPGYIMAQDAQKLFD